VPCHAMNVKPRYTIEDLFDLVFPPDVGVNGYFCMVYHCFLDDSKDQNQSKLMVSAGFCGNQADWTSLRVAWSGTLKKHGLEYFKSSEYNHLDGQFERFRKDPNYPKPKGREAAREIRSELQAILSNHPRIFSTGICIPLDDYAKVCARPEAADVFKSNSPYHRSLEAVLFETVKMVRSIPGRNMVAFVHDDGPDFAELHALYKGFKIKNPKTAKFLGGFQSLDDKEHPPLQLADMVANFTLEAGLNWLTNGRKAELAKEMDENIGKLGIWNEHTLLSVLKRNLILLGKPVPADLQSDEYG
jgi:hypothetical protein